MSKSKPASNQVPFIDQFETLKQQNPDSLLLFRVGDFYECYGVDAEFAAKVVGLTITTHGPGTLNSIPMCGFPYHMLDMCLRKLIEAGRRVSICERTE